MKQKKGISLIVLVIVIIVLLIISGAVIISLTNTNIIDMGENAVQKHNLESVEEAINLAYQDVLVMSLGKVTSTDLARKLENLRETYTEIQNITPGNGKVYYTLSLTGKEYQISTFTGETKEYIDSYEKVLGEEGPWVRNGSTIVNYTGENLKDLTVPNVLKDANGNEIKITNVSLKGIDFQGTLAISSGLIINVKSFQACNNIQKLIIGDNVQILAKIGEGGAGSFKDCAALKEVTMGKNIKIEDAPAGSCWPFVNCTALETITVESFAQIGRGAFWSAGKALKGIVIINEGVTTIGQGALEGCINVESITLPSTLKTIGASAFANCKTAKINFPENITSIGASAFKNCKNMTIDLKLKTGTTISNESFSGTGIKTLEIGEGITLYGYSFYACENLEKVVMKDNVTMTENSYLFGNCPVLKTVEMGENIKIQDGSWGSAWSFVNCPSLETVTVKSLSQVGKRTFAGVGKALKGTVKINEGVTVIGADAFLSCINVENIVLPSTLTTINMNAFNNCKGLKSLSINMTEEQFANVTKGSNWNTNVPVSVTCLVAATE